MDIVEKAGKSFLKKPQTNKKTEQQKKGCSGYFIPYSSKCYTNSENTCEIFRLPTLLELSFLVSPVLLLLHHADLCNLPCHLS